MTRQVLHQSRRAVRIARVTDALGYRELKDAQISPNGSRVAVVESGKSMSAAEREPASRILLVDVHDGACEQVTAGGHAELGPRWSPDGRTLSLLSDPGASGSMGIYLWTEDGGGASPLSRAGAPGISRSLLHTASAYPPRWSPGGDEIAYLAPFTGGLDDVRTGGWGGPGAARRDVVYVAGLDGRVRRHSDPAMQVWEFDWDPAGNGFVAVASRNAEEAAWHRANLCLLRPDNETVTLFDPTRLGPSASRGVGRQIADPRFSPDGQWVSFLCCTWSDRGLVAGDLCLAAVDGSTWRNLTDGQPFSVSASLWRHDGACLVATASVEGEQAIIVVPTDGGSPSLAWRGQAAFAERCRPQFSLSERGTIALVKEDHASAPEAWLFDLAEQNGRTWKKLTCLQPRRDHLQLSSLETLHWKSADGTACQGHLLLPPGAEASTPLPLVVFPHGGPVMLHQYLYHGRIEGPYGFPFELFPANGLALLLPNPRGSFGWGTEFTEAIVGELGGKVVDDVLSGVDYCVAHGYADGDRLGIAGWSASGYLAAWATCLTQRFSAAMVGAGYVELRSVYSAAPAYMKVFHQADLFAPGGADRGSPSAHVDSVNTPTLIVHCASDAILDVGQARLWHRLLEERAVPTELVIYEGETHALMKTANQIDLGDRVIAWFRRWLVDP